MLSKDDLVGLGMTPGPLFAQVFKATKAAKTKEEAIAIAISIRDGTFVRKERKTKVIAIDSVLHWCLENRSWLPSSESRGEAPSISEINRMLEQGAITLNGRKPQADDRMEFPIWELVFFKGSKTQCTIFFELSEAPPWATWKNSQGEWIAKGGMNEDGTLWDAGEAKTRFPPMWDFNAIRFHLAMEEIRLNERLEKAEVERKARIAACRIKTSAWTDLKTRVRCWWFLRCQSKVSRARNLLRNL